MSGPALLSAEEERLRPLYARVLRLRHVDPGGMLCFVFFEGTIVLGLLLALAELVNWWGVLVLPATVAVMVKVNDAVAAAVVRSAARVPALERERFRREMLPVVGRAAVPGQSASGPALRPAAPGPVAELTMDLPPGLLPAGFGPTGGPARTTTLVRARPELASRPRPHARPTGRPKPGPGARSSGPPALPSGGPVPPAGTPADGTGDGSGGTPRMPAGAGGGQNRTEPSPAVRPEPRSGRPLNSHPIERLTQRPIRRWLVELDPLDSARQRARQSAKRRYE